MEKILFLSGLLPLVIYCLIGIIKKKRFLTTIPMLVVTVGIGVSFCVFAKSPRDNGLSEEKYNYLCEMNLAVGNYGTAAEYLERMNQVYGDTPAVLTAQLRLAALEEDAEDLRLVCKEISVYPNRSDMALSDEESALVDKVASGEYVFLEDIKWDLLVYESVTANGQNPEDYGISAVSSKTVQEARENSKNLLGSVTDALEDSLDRFNGRKKMQPFVDAVETAATLRDMMEFPWNYEEEPEHGMEQVSVLNKMAYQVSELTQIYEQDKEIFVLPEMKSVYVEASLKVGKPDTIIRYADKSGDADALAVAAHLYMTNESENPAFEVFESDVDYTGVVEKCEKIFERIEEKSDSTTELSDSEKYLDAIVAREDNMVLANIESRLSAAIEKEPEKAESLIQKAVINSVLEDKDKVYESLDMALACREQCTNEELADTLEEISCVVDNVAEKNAIVKFQGYLEKSYAESLVLTDTYVQTPEEYLNIGNTYANEKRSMINVGNIQIEEFPAVKAYVSTLGIDLTKVDDLIVVDNGMAISDFKVEKVEYDGAQIVLVCDNSGSMNGSVEQLQAAVEKFINTRNKNEKIGIVTFDSAVIQNTGISGDSKKLLDAVNAFGDFGGTNISAGVNAAFGEYQTGQNTLNVMVVMTDGQDSSYSGRGALEMLRATCLAKNVVLYTIGLGDVSVDYLENIAASGMGSFVYSSSAVQLEDLYTFIHNQVESNYLVTYQALDETTQRDRTFTISSASKDFTATREYSLVYDVDSNASQNGFVDVKDGIAVSKLGVSTIIKSTGKDAKYEFTVLGNGFEQAENITVSVEGQRQYVGLNTVVTGSGKLTVTLPGDVACDTYDVKIAIDGTIYTLSPLRVLKEGKKEKLTFGDYTLEAYVIDEKDGKYYLSGDVILGDYLHFYGDIAFRGSTEGNTLVLEEKDGSYIDGEGILPGLLAQFFDNRIDLPKLDGITLYREANKYDMFYTHGKSYYGPLKINSPNIELCPEHLNYSIVDFSFDFPLLENILKATDNEDAMFPVSDVTNKVVLGKGKIGIILNVKSELDFDKELHLGPAELEMDSFELEVNTFNHDYALGLAVELEDVPILGNDESTYGFKIGIKSGRFDAFDLAADLDIDAVTLVPPGLTMVTLSDFHAGVEGMAGESQDATFVNRILGSTFYGQTDVNFFKLNELIPGTDALLGDILDLTVLKLDDTKLGLTISDFNISLDSKAVLLEMVDLGSVEVDLGSYTYDNVLLGISSSKVAGVHLKAAMDHKLDFGNNFKINVTGSSQVDINKAFAGALMNGDINCNIKIFKRFTADLEGNCLIGIHNKGSQFTVLVKGEEHGSRSDIGIRVSLIKGNWLPEVEFY